jgi:membrane protein DedA with SNARE-associated domain
VSIAAGTLIARYGLAAIALGAMAEGESILLIGGMLAHRGTLNAPAVVAVAFAGTVFTDQLCFWIGRRHRDSRLVMKARANPAFARALRFIERWPTGYILAFRFLYGLRVVSPIALGVSQVPASRFVPLNLIAAAIWAPLFVMLGYVFGGVVESVLGRIVSVERYVLIAVVVGAIVLLAPRLWTAFKGRQTPPAS